MKREEIINRVPLDLEGILEIGVEKWYDTFDWPFSWAEFVKLEDDIKSVLNKNIKNSPEFSNLILINYKLFIEYSNLIYGLKLLIKLKDKVIVSENNPYYKSLIENEVPGLHLIEFPCINARSKQNLKAAITKIKRFVIDNKFSLRKFSKKKFFILKESLSPHTLKYLQRECNGLIYQVSFFDFYDFKREYTIPNSEYETIITLINKLIKGVKDVARVNEVTFTAKQESFIFKHTLDLFVKSHITLIKLNRNMRGKKMRMFIGSNNNYFSRILSVAIRGKGGKIYGFKHGEPINYYWDLKSWLELSLNNYFFEYTSDGVKDLVAITEKFPPPNNNDFEILTMQRNEYEDLFAGRPFNSIKSIRSVILIGNSYKNHSFSTNTTMHLPLQLYIEIKVLKKLTEMGFKVIYKPHPEGYFKDRPIDFFPLDIEVLDGKFEDKMHIGDAFAFYYTNTTTLGDAILIKKPIFYFDFGINKIHGQVGNQFINSCIYYEDCR